jgi:hypothetical protein
MCGDFPRDSGYFAPYLVFRPRQEDSSQYLNKFAALGLELIFREIPGQSVQRRWMPGRRRPIILGLRRPRLHPIRHRVLRIAAPPRRLRFRPALALAFLIRARPLPRAHPAVRPKPFSTIPAWSFLQRRAHPHQARRLSTSPPQPPPAYFWRADPAYFSRAAKGHGRQKRARRRRTTCSVPHRNGEVRGHCPDLVSWFVGPGEERTTA